MPNTASAKKALRSSLKKRVYNNVKKAKIKQAYKGLRKNIVADASKALPSLSQVFSALDKAVKTKFITRKTADRKKARASKLLSKAQVA
jgi:small subunit ribosomal protein S20